MTAFIKGSAVYLRGISHEDVTPEYLSWLNDREATSGLVAGLFPTSLEELTDYVARAIEDPNTVMFAICSTADDKHVGNIKLDNFDWVARTCEMGILIGQAADRGQGIGTEACRLCLRYAFDSLNLRKVRLAVFDNNPAAIRVYEKLGFQHEGRLRQNVFVDNKYCDKLYMGIFKKELK